jgi:O-antigen ligase
MLAHWRMHAASIGICFYVATFWIPLPFHLPTVVLLLCAATASPSAPKFSPRRGDALPLVLAFVVASALSTLTSQHKVAGVAAFLDFLPPLLIYVLLVHFYRGVDQLLLLIITLTALALALALAVLFNAYRLGGAGMSDWQFALALPARTWVSSLNSPVLRVPNDVTLMAVLAPFALVLLVGKRRTARGLGIAALVATVLIVLTIRSRGALLALGAALLAFCALTQHRRTVLLVACLLTVAVAVDIAFGSRLIHRFTDLIDPRLASWWEAYEMFLHAPLLGHGPGSFGPLYHDYLAKTPPPVQFDFRLDREYVPWAHSLYLELLAERGVVGFALFCYTIWSAMRKTWGIAKNGSRELRWLSAGVFSCLVAFAAAALWELSLIRIWVLTVWLICLGVTDCLRAIGRTDSAQIPR